ncbi:uncharacterized protein LOC116930043 [Daphnia magna]|uniref:uncharacterized protein LOC116930043 n=1 Tax=Daphnia magna TaxID=35525 RepID=UPI001E1BC3B4|nr:uncharacterized protein LOC116930043 [Daphnia magna]
MPTCFAPGCTNRRENNTVEENRSFFSFPNDVGTLSLWKKAIPRNPSDITKSSKLCDINFNDSDIMKTVLKTVNGKRIEVPSRGRIKGTAVPTKFPICPSYLSRSKQPKRLLERLHMRQVAAKKSKEDVTVHQSPTDNVEKQSDIDIPSLDSDSSTVITEDNGLQAKDIKVPNQDWNLKHSSTDLDSYLLHEVTAVVHGGLLHVRKSMKINFITKKIEFHILNTPYTSTEYPEDFTEITCLQAVITKFSNAALCPGIVDEKYHTIKHIQIGTGSFDTGVSLSSTCSKLLEGKKTKRLICGSCHAFKTNVLTHRLIRFNDHGDRFSLHTNNKNLTAPELKIKLKEYKKEKRNAVKNTLRGNKRKKDAAAHLTALKKEFQVFKEDSVANILDGLSGKLALVMQQTWTSQTLNLRYLFFNIMRPIDLLSCTYFHLLRSPNFPLSAPR